MQWNVLNINIKLNQSKYNNKDHRLLMKLSLIAFLIIMMVAIGEAKVYTNTLTISQLRRNKGWLFMDRMSFDVGNAWIRFQLKIQTQTDSQRQQLPVDLAIIPQAAWEQEHTFQCDLDKKVGNQIRIPIAIKKAAKYQAQIIYQLNIDKPSTYHFAFRDCHKSIINQYFRKETKLILSLQIRNNDYQHGADEHLNKFMLPMLLLMTGAMLYFSKGPKHGDAMGEQRDWAKLLLFITLAFNLVAIFFYYAGFLIYTSGGYYYGFFDFMYLLFHSISESLLSTLIIFIAYGWTITFTKDAEFDLYVPLISMLGLINLILTLLGKINDGDYDKYHMYDTIPSYLLVFFKIIHVIIFLIGLILLFRRSSKNPQVVKFLANFGFIGAIYFFSLPAIMLLATFLPHSSRRQIVFFSVQVIKNIINVALTWMISSKRSNYTNIKHSGQSFFQSGNKLL